MNGENKPLSREMSLLGKLLEQTEREKLRWTASESDWQFIATARESSFVVVSVDGDDLHPIVLTIVRNRRHLADIRSREAEPGSPEDQLNDVLMQTYRAAKRSALSIGPDVANVLRDLDRLDEPPPPDDEVPF